MAAIDPVLANLLERNAKWAKAVEEADPGFFERSSKGQSPQVSLHISSSSSISPDIRFWFSLGVSSLTFLTHILGVVDWLFGFEGPRIGCYGIQTWRDFRPQEHRQVRLISAPLSHPRTPNLCACADL